MAFYNPAGYVPGGASPALAGAIRKAATTQIGIPDAPTATGAPLHPAAPKPAAPKPPAATAPPAAPAVDPQTQAAATVDSQLAPILASIRAQNEADTTARSGAITNMSKELANLYQQYANAPSPYDTSVADASKAEDYLTNRLTSGGRDASSNLASALAGIQADPTMAKNLADHQAAYGSGLGTTSAGLGSAGLEQLLTSRSAQSDYASKQPGNAALAGLGAMRDLQGKEATSLAQALAQVEGQRPSLINSVVGNIQSQEAAAAAEKAKEEALAQSAAALGLKKKSAATAAAQTAKKIKISQQSAANSASEANQRITIAQQNADTASSRATTAAQKAAAEASRPNASLSRARGFLVGPDGGAIRNSAGKLQILPGFHIASNGRVVKDSSSKKKSSNPFQTTPTVP